jgi:hypothetical protein
MTFITQAIETKFLGPTHTKGARIKASAYGANITIPYDYALSTEKAHAAAALDLIAKMGWTGTFAQGGNVTGTGYYFVNVECAPA